MTELKDSKYLMQQLKLEQLCKKVELEKDDGESWGER